jgi:DNA-binding GntR family transcriptional regulator
VEGLAARCAAGLASVARTKLTEQLTRLNDRLERASKARAPRHDLLYELDEGFHRAYVTAAAGPRLRALHDAVKPQAERYERLYVSLLSRGLAPSVAEHRAIIRAIKSGDADAAQRAVQLNWRNAADRLVANGERGDGPWCCASPARDVGAWVGGHARSTARVGTGAGGHRAGGTIRRRERGADGVHRA